MDAFAYIGMVNRRLPLYQKLTSDLLVNKKGNRQSWWMMAGCLLLSILLLLFSGRIGTSGNGANWPWLIFVILFLATHVGMMFRHGKGGSRTSGSLPPERSKDEKNERSKSDDGSNQLP